MSDEFRDLSPAERVRVVDHYAAERADPLDGFPLSEATRRWITVAKLTIADDFLSDERRQQLLDGWHRHLNSIPVGHADAAEYELRQFVAYLNGLLGVGLIEDEDGGDES